MKNLLYAESKYNTFTDNQKELLFLMYSDVSDKEIAKKLGNSSSNDKCYIEGTGDLEGRINSTKFKLELGNHPNKELQKHWKEHGESDCTIESTILCTDCRMYK